jgi:hypothetical protein
VSGEGQNDDSRFRKRMTDSISKAPEQNRRLDKYGSPYHTRDRFWNRMCGFEKVIDDDSSGYTNVVDHVPHFHTCATSKQRKIERENSTPFILNQTTPILNLDFLYWPFEPFLYLGPSWSHQPVWCPSSLLVPFSTLICPSRWKALRELPISIICMLIISH